jgi:DnaJ-class molecular chaperone
MADTEECTTCKKQEGEVNHPEGMIFVGWGHGWQPCPICGGSTRVPKSETSEEESKKV